MVMEFSGFEVYPIGKAKLSIEESGLRVSEISDSGLDGVLIKIDGDEQYTVEFDSLKKIFENNGLIQTTSLVRNGFGQVLPYFESLKWYSPDDNKVIFGYNTKFLPEKYMIFGVLDGKKVFDLDSSEIDTAEPGYPSPAKLMAIPVVPIIVAVIAAGAAIYAAVHTKHTVTTVTTYDAHGQVLGFVTTVTDDPEPFEVEINGKSYMANDVGVDYTSTLPDELVGKQVAELKNAGIQITARNISDFGIISIKSK